MKNGSYLKGRKCELKKKKGITASEKKKNRENFLDQYIHSIAVSGALTIKKNKKKTDKSQ